MISPEILSIYLFINAVSGFYYGFMYSFQSINLNKLKWYEALSYAIAISSGFWIIWLIVKLEKNLPKE